MSTISLGRKEQLYVQAESAFGQAVAPAATGAIRHLHCTMNLTEERAVRDDRKITRGAAEQVRGKRGLEWSVEGYLIPSGEATTLPDIDALLHCSFDRKVTDAATVASDPTAIGATLSAADGMSAGDIVGFVIDGTLHAVCLQTVDTETDAVTWAPVLPSAPQVNDTVHRSVTYRLQNQPRHSATLHRLLDHEAQTGIGCVPDELRVNVAAGDPAKINFRGRGKDMLFIGTSALASAMDGSQTTLTYDGPDVFEAGVWIQIDDEVMQINDVDDETDTCTVLRAQCDTDAASHDADAVIAPYRPTPTVAGSPIAGVKGACKLGGAAFTITAGSLTVTENFKMKDDRYGEVTATGCNAPQAREVQLELDGFLADDTAGHFLKAKQNADIDVLLQAGDEVGKTFAVYLGKFRPEIPDIEAPADGEIPLRLAGPALESDGNDEVFIAFL